jgi:hypothetical protein
MILIHLVKMLLCLITTGYSIVIICYHIYPKTKKTNHRGGGNWRMPKEVALALIEGYKIKVRPKNLPTYTAAEETKVDSQTCQLTCHPTINYTLTHLFRKKQNGKRKLFPLLKTGNNNFATHSKLYPVLKAFVKNNSVVSEKSSNTKFTGLTNSKNSEALNSSPGNGLACCR